jgi:hypothetical protein
LDVADAQWWDQMPVNIAVHSMLGGYNDLGDQWNFQFPANLLPRDPSRMIAYIYHFAGTPQRYRVLKHVNWRVNKED